MGALCFMISVLCLVLCEKNDVAIVWALWAICFEIGESQERAEIRKNGGFK